MVSGHLISTRIPWVNGLSMGPLNLECHINCLVYKVENISFDG